VQQLTKLRAERRDLRRAPTTHIAVGEQTYIYRRGRTLVALNNDVRAAEVRVPTLDSMSDVLGICAPARRDGDAYVISLPPRSGCVF
jgi:hypothetical protein